jgi:hypothetical protein
LYSSSLPAETQNARFVASLLWPSGKPVSVAIPAASRRLGVLACLAIVRDQWLMGMQIRLGCVNKGRVWYSTHHGSKQVSEVFCCLINRKIIPLNKRLG